MVPENHVLSPNDLPDYDIVCFSCGPSEGAADLTIRCYGKQFHIRVREASLNAQVKREYQRLLKRLEFDDSQQATCDTDPMEDICFWIAQQCNSRMRDFSSTIPARVLTLKDWFKTDTKFLSMEMNGDEVAAIEFEPESWLFATLIPGVRVPPSQKNQIPCVESSTIRLRPAATFEEMRPTEVFFMSKKHFFKPTSSYEPAIREIDTLLRLNKMPRNQICLPPFLYGFALSPLENGEICGILLEYIDYWKLLSQVDIKNHTLQTRIAWMKQLEIGVEALHRAGVIWGDAKPDNILVDKNNDLRIIDFEGGYSHGWVDEEQAESIEGDKQALSNIAKYLGVSSE